MAVSLAWVAARQAQLKVAADAQSDIAFFAYPKIFLSVAYPLNLRVLAYGFVPSTKRCREVVIFASLKSRLGVNAIGGRVMSKTMMTVLAGCALVLGLSAAPANAAQIFIQQSGTAPAGGDPNIITDTSAFVVGLAGVGSGPAQNPLLVGVADYNGAGPAPTISFAGCANPASCPLATIGTYGLTANTVAGFNSGTVFSATGLANAGGSVSFTNLSNAEVTELGLAAPTSFTLYVFELPTTLVGASPITIDTTAGLGDYIFAYACDQGGGTNPCRNAGSTNNNVFTNIGLVGNTAPPPVPEPASMAILGVGLLGLVAARRRRA